MLSQGQVDAQEAARDSLRVAAKGIKLVAAKERALLAEEWCLEVLRDPQNPAWADKQLSEVLGVYQHAVNAYWLLAEQQNVAQQLARGWLKDRRKRNPGLSAQEVEAEATFAIRTILIQHAESDAKVPLWVFAFPRMKEALDRWLAGEKGVPTGPKAADKRAAVHTGGRRVGIEGADEITDDAPNPEEALLAAERAGTSIFEAE
jgi:hypothetical protein